MHAPLFFHHADYTNDLDNDPIFDSTAAAPLSTWCARAGERCPASGDWTNRLVAVVVGDVWKVRAAPGYKGRVFIQIPRAEVATDQDVARMALLWMAYGNLFDGVARETVRGKAWARAIAP